MFNSNCEGTTQTHFLRSMLLHCWDFLHPGPHPCFFISFQLNKSSVQQTDDVGHSPAIWPFYLERERARESAKLSSRQRVATLKNLKYKIYFDLFNTFFWLLHDSICVISSFWCLLLYNVENSKNKEPLEWVDVSNLLTDAVCINTVPVKCLDTPNHSRVFLYFYFFLHCRRSCNAA